MRFDGKGTSPRPRNTTAAARLSSGLVTCMAACLLTAVPGPALAHRPGPSAKDVADARAAVRARGKELGTAASRLAAAMARKEELAARAGRLVEAYNGEKVRLAAAERAEHEAGVRLTQAVGRLEEARDAVAAVATHSYGGVDLTQPLIAAMADAGGLSGMLHRASVLEHMGDARGQVVQRLSDAEEVAGILRRQAEEALDARRDAMERAEHAKAQAQAAVERQVAETARLEKAKDALASRLSAARTRAERLAAQRAAAVERAVFARQRAAVLRGAAVAGARMGDFAANWALTQLGKPYVWAAAGPNSYDCSGLTMRAWERGGVRLDHWTGTQWSSGPRIPLGALRRGDLLFFGRITSDPGDIHHVGIYIGRGLMVHAPQTGDVVRIASMWRRDLVGATRPVGRVAP
ncbi:C40 family peptidase [Sinosporangium siamense]|uniref:Glycoside hydrolase n=1 Tax=Sinosporangium siamense TaxID=1367973 RepID=A0A919V9P6_9ACTN|nr:C40 family peptidase [Sinosporangium siamense]GII95643.1 glycoside hydrolase [Sinosporangium siamense]